MKTSSSSKLTTIAICSAVVLFCTLYLIVGFQGVKTGEISPFNFLILLVVDIFFLLIIWQLIKMYKKSRVDEVSEIKRIQVLKNKLQEFKRVTRNHDGSGVLEFTYLGGSGNGLTANEKIWLAVEVGDLSIYNKIYNLEKISIQNIMSIDVGGPGKVTTDAGIMGGGFGISGFLQGAVAATVINKLTEKSSVNTFLRVMTSGAEYYMHTAEIEPDKLRVLLSPLFVQLETKKFAPASIDAANQIGKLHKLMKDGVISAEDFDLAKKKLLGFE